MNKLILAIIAGIVVVGGGVFLVTRGDDGKTATVTNTSTGQSQTVQTGNDAIVAVDACDVLTESAAKQVLGDAATKGDTAAGSAASADVSVSNCVYTAKSVTSGSALAQAQSTNAAGLLVRAAKSQTGAESNKAQFGSAKPSGVEDVSGYGDKAYWNPQYGQLNILKGGNWYIVSHYTGLSPSKGTLDQAKQLADAIKNNLK